MIVYITPRYDYKIDSCNYFLDLKELFKHLEDRRIEKNKFWTERLNNSLTQNYGIGHVNRCKRNIREKDSWLAHLSRQVAEVTIAGEKSSCRKLLKADLVALAQKVGYL